MANSNEEFLEMLKKDYPNQDWGNLPSDEDAPDVFVIYGESERVPRAGLMARRGIKVKTSFQIDGEYETLEEAEAQVAAMKENPAFEGILWDTVKIRTQKPEEITSLLIMADLRKGVLDGEIKFPIHGP